MNVKDLLTKDEFIVKRIELKGDGAVHASNKRLFIERGGFIQDIVYQHISSIRIKTSFNIPAIITGAILAIVGIISLLGTIEVISGIIPTTFSWVLTVIGLLVIGFGLIKTKALRLTVVGEPAPVMLEGTGMGLDDLFIIAREAHNIPPVKMETREVTSP